MIQEIVALSIVAGAVGYSAYSIYRTFVPKKGKAKTMGCAGCIGNCSLPKA